MTTWDIFFRGLPATAAEGDRLALADLVGPPLPVTDFDLRGDF
jgi:hypothetical protein